MIIDGDGHFFETEAIFENYMEPSLRNYRPRLLQDDQGHNFWVVDGQTPYKRPSIKGAGAPGTAAPPGQALQSARRASPGSQTLRNLKERLEDLDKEEIDVRVEALSALSQMDGETVVPILRRVLARRDECSAQLRRRDSQLVKGGSVEVPPLSTRTIVVVPKAGRYAMRGANLLHRLLGMSGKIVVE